MGHLMGDSFNLIDPDPTGHRAPGAPSPMHVLQTQWCSESGSSYRIGYMGGGEGEEEDGGPLMGAAKGSNGGEYKEVFGPGSDRVNGGGALDLEAVRARRKNPRTDSAIGAMRW
jgi:hypothetical protein